MRRMTYLCAGILFAIPVASVAAAATPDDTAASTLLKAEDALFAADVHHDVAAIERGFADEAVFVHANGAVQTKADYLKATAEAKFLIKSIEASNRSVRIFGQIGVVQGTKTLLIGDSMRLSGTYLSVYVMRDGRWQLLDEQSSPEPKPASQ